MKQNLQRGFSLIEVLVVTAIIAMSALAIATMFTEQMKASRGVQAAAESTYLVGDVRELLASLVNCSRNFGPLSGTPLNPAVETTFTTLKREESGTAVDSFKLAPEQYGNGTLTIESITFGPSTYSGVHPSPSSFVTPLRLVLNKTGSVVGPQQMRERVISVHTRTDATGKVVACSTASLGVFAQEQIAEDGYIVFPNGLIIQWGTATASPNTKTTVNFPLPFPNQVFSITVSGTGDSGDNSKDNWPALSDHPSSTTKTSFKIFSANDSSDPVGWMAIGN